VTSAGADSAIVTLSIIQNQLLLVLMYCQPNCTFWAPAGRSIP
jgi:hypothetical protein